MSCPTIRTYFIVDWMGNFYIISNYGRNALRCIVADQRWFRSWCVLVWAPPFDWDGFGPTFGRPASIQWTKERRYMILLLSISYELHIHCHIVNTNIFSHSMVDNNNNQCIVRARIDTVRNNVPDTISTWQCRHINFCANVHCRRVRARLHHWMAECEVNGENNSSRPDCALLGDT